mmetsp:Transcript_99972/g.317438  ORF Transcript_99972/g.317438 Transcript_99972/m.317438 type:complete len:354 (+) Transcript_99972:2-1063(+)
MHPCANPCANPFASRSRTPSAQPGTVPTPGRANGDAKPTNRDLDRAKAQETQRCSQPHLSKCSREARSHSRLHRGGQDLRQRGTGLRSQRHEALHEPGLDAQHPEVSALLEVRHACGLLGPWVPQDGVDRELGGASGGGTGGLLAHADVAHGRDNHNRIRDRFALRREVDAVRKLPDVGGLALVGAGLVRLVAGLVKILHPLEAGDVGATDIADIYVGVLKVHELERLLSRIAHRQSGGQCLCTEGHGVLQSVRMRPRLVCGCLVVKAEDASKVFGALDNDGPPLKRPNVVAGKAMLSHLLDRSPELWKHERNSTAYGFGAVQLCLARHPDDVAAGGSHELCDRCTKEVDFAD